MFYISCTKKLFLTCLGVLMALAMAGLNLNNVSGDNWAACCLPDGSCYIVVDEVDCLDNNENATVYPLMTCEEIDCVPEPMGACCLWGECYDLFQNDCQDKGGIYNEGTSCNTYFCYTGACCHPFNGDCEQYESNNEWDCDGDLFLGQDCSEVECWSKPPGQCCLPNGGCTENYNWECYEIFGVWNEYEDCASFSCPPQCESTGYFSNIANPIVVETCFGTSGLGLGQVNWSDYPTVDLNKDGSEEIYC